MVQAYRTEFTDVGVAMSCKPQHWMLEGGFRMQQAACETEGNRDRCYRKG